jgi:hypothetical protein
MLGGPCSSGHCDHGRDKLLDVPAKLHLVVAMARVTVYHALITDYVSYY